MYTRIFFVAYVLAQVCDTQKVEEVHPDEYEYGRHMAKAFKDAFAQKSEAFHDFWNRVFGTTPVKEDLSLSLMDRIKVALSNANSEVQDYFLKSYNTIMGTDYKTDAQLTKEQWKARLNQWGSQKPKTIGDSVKEKVHDIGSAIKDKYDEYTDYASAKGRDSAESAQDTASVYGKQAKDKVIDMASDATIKTADAASEALEYLRQKYHQVADTAQETAGQAAQYIKESGKQQ